MAGGKQFVEFALLGERQLSDKLFFGVIELHGAQLLAFQLL